MKNSLVVSLVLGNQVERRAVRAHGHTRFEQVPGGERFADLFPSLVGRVIEIGAQGLELVNELELVCAMQWLAANGYFLRGGLQR